ncbi:MAG TPA: acetylxylan esterase [Bryobacteraceae bacterium]|jgi:hypothetical protein
MLAAASVLLAQAPKQPPAVVAGIPVNYDEAKTGTYTLPDPLRLENGKPVRDAKMWMAERRPQLIKLFEENQFGRSPAKPSYLSFDVFEREAPAFDGKAVRRQVTIHFGKDPGSSKADLLLYLPVTSKPVPVLVNISFAPNAGVIDDPGIRLGEVWNKDHEHVPAVRGVGIGKLNPLPWINDGIAFATIYYGDIDPDFDGGLPHGIRSLYLKPGETKPAPDEWGSIAAWGWGLSRVVDYLETDKDIDSKRIAIAGVSRLGKTVLWAGARDTRIALVIASCSGEGGAALSRRNYGETIKHLAVRYGYQFAGNYAKWGDRVNEFPVDANLLVSLIAPRPLLLQTGDQDMWSDPKGEYLSAVAAAPVYRLLGQTVDLPPSMPAPGQEFLGQLGYFMHAGGHGTLPADWDVFRKFLEVHFHLKQ